MEYFDDWGIRVGIVQSKSEQTVRRLIENVERDDFFVSFIFVDKTLEVGSFIVENDVMSRRKSNCIRSQSSEIFIDFALNVTVNMKRLEKNSVSDSVILLFANQSFSLLNLR